MLRRLVVRCLRTTSMRFNRGNLRGLTPQASRSLRWNERRLMCQCGARSMAVGAKRPGRLAAAPASHDQHPDALPPLDRGPLQRRSHVLSPGIGTSGPNPGASSTSAAALRSAMRSASHWRGPPARKSVGESCPGKLQP